MNVAQGVTCSRCGGHTALPADLRVPTFRCGFCNTELQTAAYAGHAAVSADALLGHMQHALANPTTALAAAATAPRFEGGDTSTRAASCLGCGAPVAVPLALHVHQLTCAACGRAQRVSDYISDRERFELDMARQVAGNEGLKRLREGGVPCGKCGGRNPVPDDGNVQIVCRFCGAPVLLSDHADESAVARQRLKHGVFAMRDEMIRAQQARDRRVKVIVLVVAVLVGVAILAANLLANR